MKKFINKSKIFLPSAYFVVCAAFYFLFVGNALQGFKDRGIDILPPEAGDGVEYENIAFNLYNGRGYSMYWSDPEWRAPFIPYKNEPIFKGILDRQSEPYFTAYRPPLYPLFLSYLYSAFGRNFFFARLFNFLLFYVAVILTAIVALRAFGKVAALLVLVFALFDPSLRLWSYYLMTEPLTTFLGAVLLLLSQNHQKRPTSVSALALGLTSGLLVLTRTIAIFWTPAIVLLVLAPLRKASKIGVLSAYFCMLLAVIAPWVLRNISVIGPSTSFGTQGGVNLAVDYSDAMVSSEGLWTSAASNEVIRNFKDDPQFAGLKGTERELALHKWGNYSAKRWIAGNLSVIPKLMVLKLKSLWWANIQPYHLILTIFGILGLLAFRQYSAFLVPCALLLGNSLGVAVTHNVPAGRFLIPLVPCVYLLAAAAFGMALVRIVTVTKGLLSSK